MVVVVEEGGVLAGIVDEEGTMMAVGPTHGGEAVGGEEDTLAAAEVEEGEGEGEEGEEREGSASIVERKGILLEIVGMLRID